MRDAEAVTFARGAIDRAAHLRADPRLADSPQALCLPLWQGKPLIEPGPPPRLAWVPMAARIFDTAQSAPVFVGIADGAPRFAREVPDWEGAETGPRPFFDDSRDHHPALPPGLDFGDLRAIMAELSASDAGTAAAAKGILGWHATHGFCARCGAPSEVADQGWKRTCQACGAEHFPRTDPVVIMLILHGNSVLLGRNAAWPPGMYSLLAGFMEPGESIEAAVRREVFEESGVRVGAVGYLASQPWPFPSSLMIGCRGEAEGRAITLDPVELEDALWITREQAMAALPGDDPGLRLARRGSIARFLIERWLADTLD